MLARVGNRGKSFGVLEKKAYQGLRSGWTLAGRLTVRSSVFPSKPGRSELTEQTANEGTKRRSPDITRMRVGALKGAGLLRICVIRFRRKTTEQTASAKKVGSQAKV